MTLKQLMVRGLFSTVLLLTWFVAMGVDLARPSPRKGAPAGGAPAVPPTPKAEKAMSALIRATGVESLVWHVEEAAEEFMFGGTVIRCESKISGTKNALARLIGGEADIALASRPIMREEANPPGGKSVGDDLLEIPLAIEVVAVVVPCRNAWATDLTVAELRKIWEPDAKGKVVKWSQVRAGWPEEPLVLFGAGSDAPDHWLFFSALSLPGHSIRDDFKAFCGDQTISPARERGALAFDGYSMFEGHRWSLRAVPVVNPDTGKAAFPDDASVLSGEYAPLARPLFMYVRKSNYDRRPELREFLDRLIRSSKWQGDTRNCPLPEDWDEVIQARLKAGKTGTMFDGSGVASVLTLKAAMEEAKKPPAPAKAATVETRSPVAAGAGQAGRRPVVMVDGSSTVYPIMEALAEEWQKEAKDFRVTIGVSGTGGGMKKFLREAIDVTNASRPINEAELAGAKKAGVEFYEIPIALDALAVVVNPANDWAREMTVGELKKMWEPAAEGKVMKWSDVRAGWPDEPLKLRGPGSDSGSFDFFTEVVVGKVKSSRPDYWSDEDDCGPVVGLTPNKGSLAYSGYAYCVDNQGRMRAVAIVNPSTGKAVLPTRETVLSGEYQPLSRPLFIYVNKKRFDQRPEVRRFVEYCLKNAEDLSKSVKYVPLPAKWYEAARRRVLEGKTGTMFDGSGVARASELRSAMEKDGAGR